MNHRFGACCFLLLTSMVSAGGETGENFRSMLTQEMRSATLPGPQHLRDYVSDGKLRLSLNDTILLTLENNSAIKIEQSQVEAAKFAVLRAYQPFDPQIQSSANVSRSSYPGFSQIQGTGTFSTLTQTGQINYSQAFSTGTSVSLGINTTKNSNNSGFYFLNPYYQSFLNLQFTQPLLRNGGRFVNRAPLIIARRSLQQSRAEFETQVSDALLQVVRQYWAVVQARGDLDVVNKSLAAAEASYQRDKRALELGALPPLDIYRSESEVASRRVQAIQAEYTSKEAEDVLRLIIGADQDSYVQALDLDLTEKPEPEGELRSIDAGTALQEALARRPELQIAQYALDNDSISIRLAHNHMQPDLSVSGFYQGSGVGGSQFNVTGQLMARSGLGTSLNQLFGFGFPGYGGTLTLNLPIRNRAAEADLGTALVARRRDLYTGQQVREQIALDVRSAVHQLEEAKLTLEAGKTALDWAQKSLAAEQRKYQLGAVNIFFQLDAQTKTAQAEASLLQAEVNYQIAVASLDHATGNLLQPYDVQITDFTR
jgi:outer membrane protein TolC